MNRCKYWQPHSGEGLFYGKQCHREDGHVGPHQYIGLTELAEWPNLDERIAELNDQLQAARQRIVDLEAAFAEVSRLADEMTVFANRCGRTVLIGEFYRIAGEIKYVCKQALRQKE